MLSRLNVVRLKMIRFRPLSGSYISQWNVKSIIKFYIIQSFRPLSGSYISQYIKENAEVHQFAAVSVPYRGATFLNHTANTLNKSTPQFPSPIGELHFSIYRVSRLKVWNGCFRPLSGSYISQWRANVHTDRTGPVSVPYRGATFLNTKKCTFHVMPIPVSVPYRGATFLNEQEVIT